MLNFALIVLACYGGSLLLTQMEGAFGLFARLRSALGAYRYGADGRPDSAVGRFIGCPYCVSVWVAVVATAVCLTPIVNPLVDVLAVVGAVYLLLRITGY